PSRHDSRSPCPALNVAANHGYLPRDGRDLTMWAIIKALRECYNVSWVLAVLFTVGSFIILRVGGVGKGWLRPTIELEDLAVHGVLEHNASLTHADVDEPEPHSPPRTVSPHRRSPIRPSRTLIHALFADSASGTHLTLKDIARARIRRTATTGSLPPHLSQFADSEFCLTLSIMGGNPTDPKVELKVLREWLEDERLPRGWKPTHEQ
ncbi:Cloroperoxidase, partial [Ramaria rubella]